MGPVARPFHLAARLLDVLSSRRLSPTEQAEVADYLVTPEERALFWAQPRADQRHALASARCVLAACPDRSDMVRAALFHDIGKRHSGLGAIGRSWAVLCGALNRSSRRATAYGDHGRLGAAELARAGAEPLVVAYARHHHGSRPGEIAPEDWAVLQAADRAEPPWPRRAAAHP